VIDAVAALLIVSKQSRGFENLYVTSGRWPGMFKHIGYFARSHRPTLKIKRKQDSPPHRMSESGENHLVGIHPGFRLSARRSTSRHKEKDI